MREFITGNEAVVRGALQAGCNYFAGYPITPASSILSDMIRVFQGGRGLAIQTEDEIAAIGQCIGASMAGAKAMTASSGPGLSLYSENIGLAQMGEVPLVIVNCQRMGPATGGATATGEGDVMFARHVTSGGYPLVVLAATDAASAYRLSYVAFNIAESLRTPVILLLSKDIALTRQTVDLDEIVLPPRVERAQAPVDEAFRPYAVADGTSVPAFSPIGGSHRVRFTGSIHDENGLLTTDRRKIAAKLSHLREKITPDQEFFEFSDQDLCREARILIISYGLADGAAREAVSMIRRRGIPVSHLTLYCLWPVPQRAILAAVTRNIERIVMPELNVGLYVDELRRVVRSASIESVICFDGGLISPSQIVKHVLGNQDALVTSEEKTECRY
jgi:2-oxoglutarate ferredoxin oxidoreductase subunit alpha